MKPRSWLVAAAAMIGLASCIPAADYTEAEWPKTLVLDSAPALLTVAFAPDSVRILSGDLARLRAIAAAGGLVPSDRVVVAVAGSPALASARFDAIAAALLPYNVVVSPAWLVSVPPNRAVIQRERYLVGLPPCPNWSKPAAGAGDFTNTFSSNFGCASTVNLGIMVAMPADLLGGRQVGLTAGQPAAAAVNRYLNNRVVLPAAADVGPIAAADRQTPGAAGEGAGAGTQP